MLAEFLEQSNKQSHGLSKTPEPYTLARKLQSDIAVCLFSTGGKSYLQQSEPYNFESPANVPGIIEALSKLPSYSNAHHLYQSEIKLASEDWCSVCRSCGIVIQKLFTLF